MKNPPDTSPAMPRRDFLKTSATLAAASAIGGTTSVSASTYKRSIGANDRIRIAQIGCGSRGCDAHFVKGILPHVKETNFEVVAIADPWKKSRENINGNIKEAFGREAKAFVSYKDLLAMNDIDAVMIASPDHQHTTHLEAVAKAGKHIYVEKPLATEMDKLVRAYDAAKAAQAKGSIIQVGTQLRSYPGIVGAREVMKSGILGKVSLIEENRNGEQPFWYKYLGRGVKKEDVDWKEFLGDRSMRPFDAKQYSAWYGYYDFCQGAVPQWGAHFLDTVHYVMDTKSIPDSCMCIGGILTWKDENNFTAPDCVTASWIYPEGFMIRSSNNFGNGAGNMKKIFGSKGTMDIMNANAPSYSAEGGPKRAEGTIRGKVEVTPIPRPDHYLNWLECMRSGETPHASIDAGFQHAVTVLMAVVSYDTGKKTTWDAKKRVIKTA